MTNINKHDIDARQCRLRNFISRLYTFTPDEIEMIETEKKHRQTAYENAKKILNECFKKYGHVK